MLDTIGARGVEGLVEGLLWHVLGVVPAWEYRVMRVLAGRGGWGERLWLPECEVNRQYRRAIARLKGPLFPGYLFVALQPGDDWAAIEDVRGVCGFLRDGDRLAALPVAEAARLRDKGTLRIDLRCGERVRVVGTVAHGLEGLYVERVGDRCKILLDWLGRATHTLVAEASVMPA